MANFVEALRTLFPQYAGKISELGDDGIAGMLWTIPMRCLLLLLGYALLHKKGVPTSQLRQESKACDEPFRSAVLAIGFVYLIDLHVCIWQVGPLASFATLQPFSLLIFNNYPSLALSTTFALCSILLYAVAFANKALRPVALLVFLFTESLVYSFGYVENTFSSFKVLLGLVCLTNALTLSRTTPLNLLFLCYYAAGCEKLITIVNAQSIGNALSLFGDVSATQILIVVIFQIMGLFLTLTAPLTRLVWVGGALAFHTLVLAKFGIGGIASPWVVSLLLASFYEFEVIGLKKFRHLWGKA